MECSTGCIWFWLFRDSVFQFASAALWFKTSCQDSDVQPPLAEPLLFLSCPMPFVLQHALPSLKYSNLAIAFASH